MRRLALFSVLMSVLAVPAPTSKADERNAERRQATRRMVERLEEVAARTTSSANSYANAARVAALRSAPRPPEPEAAAGQDLLLAVEMLRAGDTAEAVLLLERLAAEPGVSTALKASIGAALALAYLRRGEEENQDRENPLESQLLGVRSQPVAAAASFRAAIAQYARWLEDYPKDLTLRWLLNLAAMKVGEYPGGVKAAWRIPPEVFASDYDIGRFRDVAPRLGLDAVSRSGSSVMEDFDGDDDLDLMFSSRGPADQLRLFLSNRDGTFRDVTEESGLSGIVGGLNLVQADYDNDGFVDVLVLRGAWLGPLGRQPNSLLRNNGPDAHGIVTFDDVTEEAGLLTFHPTQTASWADYDNDGWVDLYVGNESVGDEVHPCELFRNRGAGEDGRVTFEEVGAEVGLAVTGFVKAVVWGDYDNDGRPDLYLSRINADNLLFHNDGPDREGRWRFTETARSAGVTEPNNSFPAWFWDYDNDGWLDLFVSGYGNRETAGGSYRHEAYRLATHEVAADYLFLPHQGETPRLYRNEGRGASGRVTFSDVTARSNLEHVLYTMGCNFGDLDNDGYLDFYVGTGGPSLEALVPNRMFRNAAGRRFQDVTASGGFGHLQKGHGISFGDLDNDGDQDVYAVMGGAFEADVYQNALFENPGHGHRWITLRLVGVESNRAALGARIRVTVATAAGAREIYSTVTSGGSFGASSLRQEIGLGDAASIRAVEITWPASGKIQVFENPSLDRAYEIREGDPELRPLTLPRLDLSPR